MKAGAGAETALYKDLNCRFCGSFLCMPVLMYNYSCA